MRLESLRELFITELQDTYDAEHQITKALPKMIDHAASPELREGLQMHLNQTEQQIRRLDQCFQLLGIKAKREKCKGMEGIIDEGSSLMKKGGDESTIDAGIIASAQKVEHYEIASYGTLCTYAEILSEHDSLSLLQQTLSEEKETDQRLTSLAERMINPQALRASGAGSPIGDL